MRIHVVLTVAALLMPAVGAAQTVAPVGQPRFLHTTPDRPSTPAAINNFGDVAGWHVAEDGDNYHAFVWTWRTGFADIGTLGGAASQALDINDLGQVIGWAMTPEAAPHAFFWTRSRGMRDLGPSALFSPTAINNLGVMAGSTNGQAAVRMPDGTVIPLGTLGGPRSAALDINDRGEVVGGSTISDAPGSAMHPFFWSRDTGMVDVHEPGTTGGAASRINNRGVVAGYLTPDATFQSDVYTWTREGGFVNIGGYPGGFVVGSDYGNVFGINGLSQVVATSTFPGDEVTRQLLWSDGGPFVIAEDGIPDYSHMGINDVGEVAGAARPQQGQMTAAVWMTVLTSEQQSDSLRVLVEGLVLRGALRQKDAKALMRMVAHDQPFVNHVAALVRSGRLTAKNGWLLLRAVAMHNIAE
jgi:probable HAF family extracellular repeat protein